MACSSMNISTAQRGILNGENVGLRRSSSVDELCKNTTMSMRMRRSSSENNLLFYCSGRVLASSARPSKKQVKPSRSFGIFSLQFSSSILPNPMRSLLFDTEMKRAEEEEGEEEEGRKRTNWIERLLELRMRWKGRREMDEEYDEEKETSDGEDGCLVSYDAKEEMVSFNEEMLSSLLVQVPWFDAKRLSKLAFLCNKSYVIPEIKANDLQLQRNYGLHFVTSSLEKKAESVALKAKLIKHKNPDDLANKESDNPEMLDLGSTQENTIRSSVAYEIAASAASHVQCREKNICADDEARRGCKSERAAQMAASTMTAVVAAKENEKQEAAKELQSLHSSPCEWFICDDPCTHVRYFVIQGSESLASWQTNLFFEPAKFEDTDALVHRGIYEAAKGIYEQFLPELQNHINTHGDKAKVQFTGHSLGGSLSQLVHMMLIARKVVKPSTLLPVVSFGSPFVFCGGHKILEQLGVDENQLHCVIMHRDIVPRAFSCSYPRQVAQVLKRLNASFRAHPCLRSHKMLYSPLGKIFILQPAEQFSPPHPWLPPGSALYALDNTQRATATVALIEFLNNPHPLETLSDPKAYGSEGTILRDHDSSNYAKAINVVIRQYTEIALRQVRRERHLIWPLIASPSQRAWTHDGNLENRAARKEIMTSV